MRRFAKDIGVEDPVSDKAHDFFTKSKRIDFIPLRGKSRGFIIIIDRKSALYFYQDGNHFVYDGYEMGEYDKGDVTVFDRLD